MTVPPVMVLIDGSNVLHSDAWGDRESSALLVDAVASWAAAEGVESLLAFDGAVERSRPVGSVQVIATGAKEADEVLAERAARLAARGLAHWLVSEDRAVRATAGAHADRVLDAASFVALLRPGAASNSSSGSSDDAADPQPRTAIGDAVSDDARARLECLRRGH